MRSWLDEIHIPYPDLTLPSGWNAYLGIDSVHNKERLVSEVLDLRQVPHIIRVLGTTIKALLCKIVNILVFWLGTWPSARVSIFIAI